MTHAQKPDFVFRRNGRDHLNRLGRRFSRLLAAEFCTSAVVMLDTPCSEVVWRVLATHTIRQFPLQFPSRASPCAITFQLESKWLTSRPGSFTPRKDPVNSRQCRSQSCYGRLGENKYLFPLLGFKFRTIQPVVKSLFPYSQKPIACLCPKTDKQCLSSLPIYWRTILTLSSHLCLGLPRGTFASDFLTVAMHVCIFTPYMPQTSPSFSLIYLSNNIWYPIPVAVLSKAWVCGRSTAGIAD